MKKNKNSHKGRCRKWAFWLTGLGSLIWLLLRSGTNPRRLAYPCQRAALATSLGFVGHLASIFGAVHLFRRLKRSTTLASTGLLIVALLLLPLLASSTAPAPPAYAQATLPVWTSPTAISNVFVVPNVPVPQCSLDGGTLPGTPPCNESGYALSDSGVNQLINEMENRNDYFYQTPAHPDGIVSADDVVVIKINNQWADNGSNRRLCTNTDTLKGLIWRILQHPEGFSGEIVVAENTQGVVGDWDITPANAQDRNQSYQDVVNAFSGLGYPVFLYRWDDLNGTYTSGGDVGSGYPAGEYVGGNASDRYILLEDAAGTGTDELSYPKFHAGSHDISLRYGVWDGSSYHPDQLTLINMPVLKRHGMAGATIAWKNLIGLVLANGDTTGWRYGNWDTMHDFFWGYTGGDNADYGLLGRQMALVRPPDLNIVDAIWVADDNYDGTGYRQDILLASTDPFAVDWYASEYILYPLFGNQDASAARAGIFRNATRTNQNAAAANWPGGGYPWIDLLDSYDGGVPSDAEQNQMNVYRARRVVVNGENSEWLSGFGAAGCPPLPGDNASGIYKHSQGCLGDTVSEFIWTDTTGDQRTDHWPGTGNLDLTRFRVAGDADYQYYLVQFDDITDCNSEYVAIAINSDDATGTTFFPDSADTNLAGFGSGYERVVEANTSHTGYWSDDSTFTLAGTSFCDAANDLWEIRMPISDLGLSWPAGSGEYDFAVAIFCHDGSGGICDVAGTSDAQDVVTNVAGNTWNEVGDGALDYNFTMGFGPTALTLRSLEADVVGFPLPLVMLLLSLVALLTFYLAIISLKQIERHT